MNLTNQPTHTEIMKYNQNMDTFLSVKNPDKSMNIFNHGLNIPYYITS